MKCSWIGVIHAVRAQARKAYTKRLCFAQLVCYVQSYLLAKIWYMAQIVPLTTAHAQQITTICTWFIWQGSIFRIPVMTLYRPKEEGGWGFPNISAKCRTLLYNRIQMMGEKNGTVLSEQMSNVDLNHTLANPLNPGIPWRRIWTHLHASVVRDMVKSAWFAAIHDTVPTNDRLAAIQLTNTSSCTRCGEPDSIQHTINECTEGRLIWTWTRAKLGMILRMDPRHIPPDWPIRPAFHYWPPQRQAALLWIIAHLVCYRLQSNRRLNHKKFMDFLRRARWKAYHRSSNRPNTGRYLYLL